MERSDRYTAEESLSGEKSDRYGRSVEFSWWPGRVLLGGRSSFAGDPVDFCQEVGRVLLAARSSFAGGRLGFAGRSVEFCRRPVDFCWPWVAHLPTPGEIAVLVEMPFLAPTLNCQLGLGAQWRRADSAGYAGPIGDQTEPN